MRFLVENYPYEVILPTFPEVSACFEFLDFVTAITYVTDVTAKHGRPLRKSVVQGVVHGDRPTTPIAGYTSRTASRRSCTYIHEKII